MDQDHNSKILSNFLDFIIRHAYFFLLLSVAPIESTNKFLQLKKNGKVVVRD